MKQVIDHLTSATGWIVDSPSTIGTNAFERFIAGLNSTSLIIKFDEDDTARTATKTFDTPFDVSDYDTLVLSVWSRDKGKQVYNKSSDFNYKIKINSSDEFYLPVYESMTDINIGIEDVDSITQIIITAIHSDDDYIIISEMIAEKQEPTIDVLDSVQEHIEYFRDNEYDDGINVGTTSGTVGDEYIDISNPAWIERYSVITIKEGSTEETHQISDCDGERFYFNDNYDGSTLVNTFTSVAIVYLTFPVYINPGQNEIRLPGIAIWGMTPEPLLTDAKVYTKVDTFSVNNDNFKERPIGQVLDYVILIDLESHASELIEKMARLIRRFIARESLWINGRRHDIFFNGAPTEQKPSLGIDIIPKIQYSLSVQLRENIFDRVEVPKTSTVTLTVDITE